MHGGWVVLEAWSRRRRASFRRCDVAAESVVVIAATSRSLEDAAARAFPRLFQLLIHSLTRSNRKKLLTNFWGIIGHSQAFGLPALVAAIVGASGAVTPAATAAVFGQTEDCYSSKKNGRSIILWQPPQPCNSPCSPATAPEDLRHRLLKT